MTPGRFKTQIHKFGGTSVAGVERLAGVSAILADAASGGVRLCAVTSAMGGVTDGLALACAAARAGRRSETERIVSELRRRHDEAIAEITDDSGIADEIAVLFAHLDSLLQGALALGEMPSRSVDAAVSVGEKAAARLLGAALRARGVDGRAVDADAFLETDGVYGGASPLSHIADRRTGAVIGALLDDGALPVVTGFIGRAPDGSTTTLGRGGSDFTATLLASALDAESVTIWTDVAGVYSADPPIVPEAQTLDHLHYREAAELSYYGAKVLHSRTMIPAVMKSIPVRVRNSFSPDSVGTTIDAHFTSGDHPVKAVTAVRDQALVSIEGRGMMGVPGMAARVFGALAELDISSTMISQASSESSICFATPDAQAFDAERALKRAFRQDLSAGLIEDVTVRPKVGLVAAVGLGMIHSPGIAGRLCSALARADVNILAIAQGSSELNITIAVDRAQIDEAVRSIHDEFDLGNGTAGRGAVRASAFPSRVQAADQRLIVVLAGFGQVARALAALAGAERSAAAMRIVGVSDRSGYLFDPAGLDAPRLDELARAKEAGRAIAQDESGEASAQGSVDLVHAAQQVGGRAALADCTDAPESYGLFMEALDAGLDVATANKEPLAVEDDRFAALMERASRCGRMVRGEATVGAGLPVLSTLEGLLESGDRVRSIEGSLSGTLGFVLSMMEDGASLRAAVEEAKRLGYTEPDAAVDLTGRDVERKAMILGRFGDVHGGGAVKRACAGIVDRSAVGMDSDALGALLDRVGADVRARMDRASGSGKALRFAARVERGVERIGLMEVDRDSALGALRGSASMVVFRTERYDELPLSVSGCGAGAVVTASAVLQDLLRIASARGRA